MKERHKMERKYAIKADVTSLWRGCILACIAHAIMVAHYPELSRDIVGVVVGGKMILQGWYELLCTK
jgi:hypothetical protein